MAGSSAAGSSIPDVVVEVVPLLSLRHGEGHFPRHGSHPAAGQVGLSGLGEGHTWQHGDEDKEKRVLRDLRSGPTSPVSRRTRAQTPSLFENTRKTKITTPRSVAN